MAALMVYVALALLLFVSLVFGHPASSSCKNGWCVNIDDYGRRNEYYSENNNAISSSGFGSYPGGFNQAFQQYRQPYYGGFVPNYYG